MLVESHILCAAFFLYLCIMYKRLYPLGFFLLLALVATWLSRDHVFFWDTVQLGSKHAHWYYENNFADWWLPAEIDSGHPPVFGMYLALCWKLFGYSLIVSHFAMLPFLWLLIWSLYRIGLHWLGPDKAGYLLWLTLVDPTLAAQAVMVSPDILLAAFFAFGVWAVLERRTLWLTLAALGLGIISMRGMMVAAGLYLFDICIHEKRVGYLGLFGTLRMLVQRAMPFLPVALVVFTFLVQHYHATGWIGYHRDSPWAYGFQRVGLKGMVHNIGVLGWRLLDFGRFFTWLIVGFALWRIVFSKNRPDKSSPMVQAAWLLFFMLLVLSPSFLLYKSLHAHRYLLPAYLAASLFCLITIFTFLKTQRSQYLAFTLVFVFLLTGNRWIYPEGIAMGWDGTLAHWPYYELRKEMLEYIDGQKIPLEAIGTAFPEIGPLKFRDLSGQERGMPEKDLTSHHWILYSNVMNDFTDAERTALEKNWKTEKTFDRHGVRFVLYHH